MKLLFLTHRMPFPPNKGDKIRSFNILAYLTKQHDVSLACLVDDESDLRFLPEIESRVRGVVFEKISPRTKKILALRNIVQARPITVGYFYSSALQEKVDEIIGKTDFDAFICFTSPMAEYLFRSRHFDGRIKDAIRIMDFVDVDSRKWQQYADESSGWTSWIYRYEAKHLARYEKLIVKAFDCAIVVSEQEKKVFSEGDKLPNLYAMSNGVDIEFFSRVAVRPPSTVSPALVFTGVMDYRPNIEGINWFVQSIFPLVQAAVPDIKLWIVGSNPTAQVERLGKLPGVIVTGFVEDIRAYLAKASVCIAPLRVARGIQNKVLEAMAMGKAVVCTPQAHEGICAIRGKEIIVAEGANEFAVAIIRLLGDPALAEQIGVDARRCVEMRYSWNDNLRLLDRILAEKCHAIVPSASVSKEIEGNVGVGQG